MIRKSDLVAIAAILESTGSWAEIQISDLENRFIHLDAKMLLALAVHMDHAGFEEAPCWGPIGVIREPVKRGTQVTLPAGTLAFGGMPPSVRTDVTEDGRSFKQYKRATTIKVQDYYTGGMQQDHDHRIGVIAGWRVNHPSISFIGPGGYWCTVPVSDIPDLASQCSDLWPLRLKIAKHDPVVVHSLAEAEEAVTQMTASSPSP